MSNELAVPGSELAIMPVMEMAMAKQRRDQIIQFTKSIMVDGTDFGVIPGTDKPTLLKPGAEKLATFFGLTKRFEIIEKIEDWTGAAYNREPFFYYLYRCQLLRGDLLVAESDGSCNSHESKYRWRWVNEDDIPPGIDKALLKKRSGNVSEFAFAIDKAETGGKYGKPVEYWQRFKDAIADGTARKISKAASSGKSYDGWEIGADVYRIPNDDIASQVNTIQKMAQKRALIAATLLAVNASEFFTQDLEDYIDGDFTAESAPVAKPDTTSQPDKNLPKNGQELLEIVNRRVDVPYDNAFHLQNALKQECGDNWKWPKPDDTSGWQKALDIAIAHARAKTQAPPEATEAVKQDDELPF